MRYPTIYALALDILPIQATSVPCEHVFSSSKETTTARRNRISGELMEQLQMLKYSIKQGRQLNFTEGLAEKNQLEVLEENSARQNETPEDLHSFAQQLRYGNA